MEKVCGFYDECSEDEGGEACQLCLCWGCEKDVCDECEVNLAGGDFGGYNMSEKAS